jgi:hypothetical protein
LPGAFFAGIMQKIILSLPNYHSRVPNNSFITSDRHEVAEASAESGMGLVSGMSGQGWAMVHLPLGGLVDVDVRKALPGSSRYRAWWVDPRIGSKVLAVREVEVGGEPVTSFQAPSGGDINNDWILYLTDEKIST